MSVVGIDFGNQNAVIAAAGRGGVDVILNGNSNRLNPCMVGFSDSRSMGEAATSGANSNYKNTITLMKRLVGLPFDDPRAQKEMKRVNFKCVPVKHSGGGVDTIGVEVTSNHETVVVPVEAVAGMMVKHLGSIAAKKAQDSAGALDEKAKAMSLDDVNNPLFPQDWVVAVPGYYTDAQKRAFLVGCEIAGIKGVQRLMHENTATALAYGIFKDIRKEFNKDKPTNVMFIDMGYTSYSVSICAFEPGKLTVKSSHFDQELGGRDFDLLIATWLAGEFEAKYKGKLSGKPMERPKTMNELMAAAEKAKKTLSPAGVKEARINLECLMDDFDFSATLKAEKYEEMCAPLLARLEGPIKRALEEANLQASDLVSVEIVGGSTRIGCVKRTLAGILGLDASATNNGLSTTMNADEAVSRGAALQSAILSPRFKVLPYEIVEHQPFPVKVSWDGDAADGAMEVDGDAEGADGPSNSVVMFERGSNFPIVRRVTLRRAGDFTVNSAYDESADEHDFPAGVAKEIAAFTIKAPAGEEKKIHVNVKQDINGCISLSSAQMVEEIEEDEPATEEAEKKEDEEAKAEEEPKKKKKTKKTNLEFTENRPVDFAKADIEKYFEEEVKMTNADRVVRETADMRNELESYIYDMRDKIISDSHLAPFATDEEKSAFSSALETNENWLYEDGFDATKSVYAEKLGDLKKLGDPIAYRQSEAANRPNAVTVLQRTVEKYNNWLNTSQALPEYDHITEEEWEMCNNKTDEVSGWMYDMLDKQGSLAQNVNPVMTVADINAKNTSLVNTLSPIMHKPKPKPKAEEKPKEEPKPAEGEAPAADAPKEGDAEPDAGEPMDAEAEKPADDAEAMQVD